SFPRCLPGWPRSGQRPGEPLQPGGVQRVGDGARSRPLRRLRPGGPGREGAGSESFGLVSEACVIGLGLIGGSLLRAADAAGWKVRGAPRSDTTAAAARDAGFDVTTSIEDLLASTADDALVVLAVPLPAVVDVLAVLARQAPRCRLTDVVSVKQPVAS